MALTQMQLIQSLGEAMAWFEREMNWGVPATELRHLCGRIGELYAAMITNGQMATAINQKGYDVISGDGERISVKTTATTGCHGQVLFNTNTLEQVDRIIILRVNTEEMQIEVLLDQSLDEAKELMSASTGGKKAIALSKLVKKPRVRANLAKIKEVAFNQYLISELENGTIEVKVTDAILEPVKPILREIARELNLNLLNSAGNFYNTRQLGSQIIKTLNQSDPPATALVIEPDDV